nr:hypothetical protein [Candidatus Sigynarchaeum springense]
MPRYHHHHHYGRRGNPICGLIACVIFIVIYVGILGESGGYYALAYFSPYILLFIILAVGGIIAAIITSARRRSQMQAQPVGTTYAPPRYPAQDYPPAGYPAQGPAGAAAPQPGTYSPATFQGVPRPRLVGYPQSQTPPQPLAPTPAIASRFCKYCGVPAGGDDQRFCANCGARL